MTWKVHTAKKTERKRIHEGMIKFQEALLQDAKETSEHGSGLPKDWSSRILKVG